MTRSRTDSLGHRFQRSAGLRAGVVLLTALVVAFASMAVLGLLGVDRSADASAVAAAEPDTTPVAQKSSDDKKAAPAEPTGPQVAVVKRRTALLTKPGGGKRVATIDKKTNWKAPNWEQPRVLPIVGREGDWLEVIATERPNNKTGWIRARHAKVGENRFSVHVDLSDRRITVKNGNRTVRKIKSAVGEGGTPTPTGKFAVTDRFNFTDAGSVYGCCALALSAHQTQLAPGWAGDDRVAIHATPDKASIGSAATNGCMRVPDKDAAWLMTRVPLGTVVTIRS